MYKKLIHNLVEKALQNMGIEKMPPFNIVYPPQGKMGDYSTSISLVAGKILHKMPMEIALDLKSRLEKENPDLFEKVEAVPPGFVNFNLNPAAARKNLSLALRQKDSYGRLKIGKGKTVVIDYSAPNIAKVMHVGHLRSTIIGQALYNIYEFLGYKVVGDNHIGDWGTHFGKLIYAYKNFADKKKLKKNFIGEITRLYVDFNARAKADPRLDEFARQETKKFQDGDPANVKIWKYFVHESLEEFGRLYEILDVKFDYTLGESSYQEMLPGVIEECLVKNLAVRSEGAMIIPLEKYGLSPLMIQKSDGATLYATTDLATMKYRIAKWHPEKILYVVSNEQAGHLAQVFRAAELLGYLKPAQAAHIKFGMVLGADGKKFASREGKIVMLEDLVDEAVDRAWQVVEEKNPALPAKEKNKISRAVGLGAIKYNDLSQNRLSDIAFDWDKMLNFTGNSAPYLQYTYARIKSILRKSRPEKKFQSELLADPKEMALLRLLMKFSEAVEESAAENNPNVIANYLYGLANAFNLFYESVPVIKAEKSLRLARLGLISGVAIAIKNGLSLLGIETLERM